MEYRAGHREAAFAYLEEAIRGNKASAEPFYCRGIFLLDGKKKKEALADLEEAKRLDPTLQGIDSLLDQARH